MNANETKVDVLGALREFATKRDPFGSADEAMRKYIEARDAVAELIDAATVMNQLAKKPVGGVSQYMKRAIVDRMDAALSRIGGAK